nr:unnamed protein product [Callosobruchus analis]
MTPDSGLSYKNCELHQEQRFEQSFIILLCKDFESDHKVFLFHKE